MTPMTRATKHWWGCGGMMYLMLAIALLLVAPAQAAPPQDADPALAAWFQSLRQPGTGHSCCSIADCRTVEHRIRGNHYEAFIEREWIVIPADRILQRTDNPTGHAVACWNTRLEVLCFVRESES